MLKVVCRHTKNVENEGFIGFRYTIQALTLHKPNGGSNDGFGREAMELTIFEAEDIASQVKRADLAATVRQKFVTPRRAFNHLI